MKGARKDEDWECSLRWGVWLVAMVVILGVMGWKIPRGFGFSVAGIYTPRPLYTHAIPLMLCSSMFDKRHIYTILITAIHYRIQYACYHSTTQW